MTPEELAPELGISPKTLRQWLRDRTERGGAKGTRWGDLDQATIQAARAHWSNSSARRPGVLVPTRAEFWWDNDSAERYWIEVRKIPGTGTELSAPLVTRSGAKSGAYELLDVVKPNDVVYHWHATQSRFVGRSVVAERVSVRTAANGDPERHVPLRDFNPLVGDVDLNRIRSLESEINALHSQLAAEYPGKTLYLPFQFRSDGLRMVSYYFAKMPQSLVELLFGESGWADEGSEEPPSEDGEALPAREEQVRRQFLQPFKPKADADYVVKIEGGTRKRGRRHETLVNDFTKWLGDRGMTPGRNQAIDIGLEEPPVIVEAKVVVSWKQATRQAVGQLYEYKYFQVVSPDSRLIFLADKPVPAFWLKYLEEDRGIAVAWQDGGQFVCSNLAKEALGSFD